MRILAVDPGEKHIGTAISDPTGTVARPLTTLQHEARAKDAARLVALAAQNEAELVLIGYALDSDGRPGPQARQAERLAEAVRAITSLPVALHDESFSTLAAQAQTRLRGARGRRSAQGGKRRRALRARTHAVAAAAILQSYLDGQAGRES